MAEPRTMMMLFPNDDDTKFDLDYYMWTHLPKVQEKWTPYGLKSYKVFQLEPSPDGSKPPYTAGTVFEFDKIENIREAFGAEVVQVIFGDIPNFSNKNPVMFASKIVKDAVV